MHVHQSLAEGRHGACSRVTSTAASRTSALYYIGGIIKHAKAINAFTNAGYEQLQAPRPGLRSAGHARVLRAQPFGVDPHSVGHRIRRARRIEVRFPDSARRIRTSAFAAMMMAGLDGIQNKIHPGEPADKDLYDLEPEEEKHIPTGVPLAGHGARRTSTRIASS